MNLLTKKKKEKNGKKIKKYRNFLSNTSTNSHIRKK
jgi:hypothetical protein